MKEETIFDENGTNDKGAVFKKESKKDATVTDKTTKGKNKSGVVTAAGIAGVASYAAGIFTPLQVFPSESGDLSERPGNTTNLSGHHAGHDLDVATGIDDSMSFNEAFAAARDEVGAGGIFVWHGNTYGTYYAEEWNSMSADDKEQYWANVHHTSANLSDELNNPTEVETPIEEPVVEPIPEPINGGDIPLDPPGGWETEPEPTSEPLVLEPDPILSNNDPIEVEPLTEDPYVEPISEPLNEENPIEPIEGMDIEPNLDVDILASNSLDPDIPIENDMDMGEYV